MAQASPRPPAPAALLAVSIGQFAQAGAKGANQDFHGMVGAEADDLASKGIALAIADGISTSPLGAEAAETAVKSFLADYHCTPAAWSVQTSGERVIAAANSWMHAQNRGALVRDGLPDDDETREAGLICTLSALVLKSRSAHLFHVGDGQVARLSGGSCEPLTEPHRVAAGAARSWLARAMGVNRHVEIDYRQVPLAVGDIFVMTTDGVHDALPPSRMAAIVADAPALDDAARDLCAAARAAGSEDDLTAQIVRIDSLPAGELGELVSPGAALPPAPMLAAGQDFEGYRIIRSLHAGARSHVWLARDLASGEKVALKTLSIEAAQDPARVVAMLAEEWVMRRVAHPNLLGAPVSGQRPRQYAFAVARQIEGQSLEEWRADHPRPDLATVRDIVRQLASGLLAMHRREMIHRDVRPANVMIDADGTVTLIDFGSAIVAGMEQAAPGSAGAAQYAGTVQFSAPELYRGEAASPASDLFSLGVLTYWLIGGELPYGPRLANATTFAAQRKHAYRPLRDNVPEVPDWVDAAIARACAIDPANRHRELSEFTYDLAHPNAALVRDARPLLERGSARDWRAIALVLLALLLLAVLTRPDIGLGRSTPIPPATGEAR